jgi:hypothetical protein
VKFKNCRTWLCSEEEKQFSVTDQTQKDAWEVRMVMPATTQKLGGMADMTKRTLTSRSARHGAWEKCAHMAGGSQAAARHYV